MSGLDKNRVSNFYLRYRSRCLEVRILYPPLNQFIVSGSLTAGGGKVITWLLFLAGRQARILGLVRDLPDAAESSYKLIFLKIFDIIYM